MLPAMLRQSGRRPLQRLAASCSASTGSSRGVALARIQEDVLRPSSAASSLPDVPTSTLFRSFATKKEPLKEEGKEPQEGNKESLKDAVNRLKNKSGEEGDGGSGSGGSSTINTDDFLRKSADFWSTFSAEVGKTWQDLIKSGERKSINKKIHPEATAEGDLPYTGPVDIVVIDPSEHLTAWERMQKRLTEAPVIEEMVSRAERIYEESGAKKTKEKIDHLKEDAKEAWETSQNPWVYRVSSVYDTLTAETAESQAVKELRVLDPEFTLDDWRQDVVEHTLPTIMEWFLEGRINQLKPWLGEGVFKRIAAEITARKQEGVEIDTHVLGIMNSEILAVEVSFNVPQLLCRRSLEAGRWCSDGFFFLLTPIQIAGPRRQGIADHTAAFHGAAN